jgi:hypothetical protein
MYSTVDAIQQPSDWEREGTAEERALETPIQRASNQKNHTSLSTQPVHALPIWCL